MEKITVTAYSRLTSAKSSFTGETWAEAHAKAVRWLKSLGRYTNATWAIKED